MAYCAERLNSGDARLRVDTLPLAATEGCPEYVVTSSPEYAQLLSNSSGGSLPIDDPAVNGLISSIILVLVLAWVLRQVLNQLVPKGN